MNANIVRARSTDEYLRMVEQALDDVFDLYQAIKFEEDSMGYARVHRTAGKKA